MKHVMILKSLVLAPLPHLLITSMEFVGLNHSLKNIFIDQVPETLLMMLFAWTICSLFFVSAAYVISVYFNQKGWLNLLSILILGFVSSSIFFTLLNVIFLHSLPSPLWSIYTDNDYFFDPIFVAFCYWLLLKYFQKKNA